MPGCGDITGMDRRAWVFAVGATAVMAGRLPAAVAADEPLLVVVDASPQVSADAAEIRRAIGAELGLMAVSSTAAASETADRAIIVGVDRKRIAVALRARYAPPVVRWIPSPAEYTARVRAIAWLAGNLVRDQVSGIVAVPTETASPLASMPALDPPTPAPTSPEPVQPRPPTEPPALQAAAIVSAALPAPPPASPRWFLAIEAGPALDVGYFFGERLGRDQAAPVTMLGISGAASLLRRPAFLPGRGRGGHVRRGLRPGWCERPLPAGGLRGGRPLRLGAAPRRLGPGRDRGSGPGHRWRRSVRVGDEQRDSTAPAPSPSRTPSGTPPTCFPRWARTSRPSTARTGSSRPPWASSYGLS